MSSSDDKLFTGTDGRVFFLANNGTSWTAVNSGLTSVTVLSLAISGANVFAGTAGGVFLSVNNGTSWKSINSGLVTTTVQSFAESSGTILAGPRYNGVWRRPLSEMTGVMPVKHGRGEVERMKCSISTGRCAGPGVMIAFDIFSQEQVSLKVLNIAGKEIARIVDRHLKPGSYTYHWNARNCAAGCYLVKMQVGNMSCSKSIPVSMLN